MKEKLQIAFYKGNSTLLLKLIALWTMGKYSHCAVLLRIDGGKIYTIGASNKRGVAEYSANYREDDWDIVTVEDASRQDSVEFIRNELGKEYDYKAIWFTHFLPLMREENDRWFCSEIIAAALGLDNPHKFHPNGLYRYFIAQQKKSNKQYKKGLADFLASVLKGFGRN